jgi:hypothetical protein
MKLPKTIKGRLKLLIAIAEEGNTPLIGCQRLTPNEELLIGGLIADIQNNLGEMEGILSKFALKYNG